MKKNSIFSVLAGVAVMAALLFTTACSSGGDGVTTPAPIQPPTDDDALQQRIKEVTTPGADAAPSWVMDYSLYDQMEQTMSVQVVPQKFLQEYMTDGDMMCAMIGGQVRAVSPAQKTGGSFYFSLVIAGNGNEGNISIYYYCSKLSRIYTVTNWIQFNADFTPTLLGNPWEIVFYQDIYEMSMLEQAANN